MILGVFVVHMDVKSLQTNDISSLLKFYCSERMYLMENYGWLCKEPFLLSVGRAINLSTFSTDSPGELDILGHDGDPLGVDGA